jgi:hypothetical protein
MFLLHRIWLIVLIALGATAGCSEPPRSEQPALTIGPLVRITSEAQYSFPLDAYLPNTAQQEAYTEAFISVVKRCVTSYGLTWVPVGRDIESAYLWDPNEGASFIYNNGAGVVSRTRAAQYGYHDPHDPEALRMQPEPPSEAAPSEDVILAVSGPKSEGDRFRLKHKHGEPVPDGGCYEVARDKLGGAGPNLPSIGDTYDASADNIGSDSYVKALRRWVSCMRDAGYSDAVSPQMYGFAHDVPGPVSTAETRLALADVECKESSRIADVYVAVRTALQERLLEQHDAAFEEFREWQLGVTDQVQSVLGDPAPPN